MFTLPSSLVPIIPMIQIQKASETLELQHCSQEESITARRMSVSFPFFRFSIFWFSS